MRMDSFSVRPSIRSSVTHFRGMVFGMHILRGTVHGAWQCMVWTSILERMNFLIPPSELILNLTTSVQTKSMRTEER